MKFKFSKLSNEKNYKKYFSVEKSNCNSYQVWHINFLFTSLSILNGELPKGDEISLKEIKAQKKLKMTQKKLKKAQDNHQQLLIEAKQLSNDIKNAKGVSKKILKQVIFV